uniref:Granulin precursor n=1 Tax=Anser brachyrhynchus TaxID=132585 RepID=A0A8B9CGV9_9AVES
MAGTLRLLSPVTCGDTEVAGAWLAVTPCPPSSHAAPGDVPRWPLGVPGRCHVLPAALSAVRLLSPAERECVPASPRSTPGWRQAVTCGVVTRGCPPPAQAVCCSDGQHCCPQGTTCDLERSMFGDVKCDDEMSCPDGNTCCRLSSGAWGCCPLEQVGGAWGGHAKTPARGRGGDVKCDDETSCPDGSTCCQLTLGTWACCPLEQGCGRRPQCPLFGHSRDCVGVSGGGCMPRTAPPAAPPRPGCDTHPSSVALGWGGTQGAGGGGAGCHRAFVCTPPQAVCCKDHQHCCPRGYTCNVATQSCEKLLAATPLRSPAPAGSPLRPVATIPGDTARACLPGQRCCRSKDGAWARCPFAQVSGWHFGAAGPGRCPRARGGRGGAGRGAGAPCRRPAGRCRSGGRGTRGRPARRTRRAAPAASAPPVPAAPR